MIKIKHNLQNHKKGTFLGPKNYSIFKESKIFEPQKLRFSRKAQVSSQIFVYILAAIIIGILFLVGFKAIATVLGFTSGAPMQEFQTEFSGKVSGAARSYGKVERFEFSIPDKFDEICFIDSLDENEQHTANLPGNANQFIKDVVDEGVGLNVFYMKDGTYDEGSFYVEKLDIATDDYLCLENGDRLEVWLEGVGGSACLMVDQSESCD